VNSFHKNPSQELYDIDGGAPSSKGKSCVIIVTYNKIPNLKQINNALLEGHIDGLIVVDNSNRNDLIIGIKLQFLTDISSKYSLIENHENLGISRAINKGLAKAIEESYEYIYLLDDDAVVSKYHFSQLRKEYEDLVNKGEKVGIVCPIVSNNYEQMDKKIGKTCITEINGAITSGMLISRNTIKNVGTYNEDYFLEFADIEFCSRIRKEGLKIFRVNRVLVCQDFGNTVREVKISFVPLFLYTRIFTRSLFIIGFGNNLFSYSSIYPPERTRVINKGNIKLIFEDNKSYISKILRLTVNVLFIITKGIMMFIVTEDVRYLKLGEGL
jgi:GT2 family glycosyltransferase